MSKPPECTLMPVHGQAGCAGHLRRTAPNDGATALLALATNGDKNE
jgi:hypothetical protein